jgi:hypothetical protein
MPIPIPVSINAFLLLCGIRCVDDTRLLYAVMLVRGERVVWADRASNECRGFGVVEDRVEEAVSLEGDPTLSN